MSDNAKNIYPVISDDKIVDMYWRKEENAIKETDKKYGQFLYRIAYNILHDSCDSDECKNDTYLSTWNSIPPTRPNVFPAFLVQIMRHIAINRYKEKNRQKRIPSELTVSMEEMTEILQSNESIDDYYNAKEVGKIISNYVRTLSERGQYIFIGRFYRSESVERLSEELSISIKTVYRELDKIKCGLKVYLEKNGVCI